MAHHKAGCFQRTWPHCLGFAKVSSPLIILSHLSKTAVALPIFVWTISNGARALAARTCAQATVLCASAVHICVGDYHSLAKHLIYICTWHLIFQCCFCSLLMYREHNIDVGFWLTQSGENLRAQSSELSEMFSTPVASLGCKYKSWFTDSAAARTKTCRLFSLEQWQARACQWLLCSQKIQNFGLGMRCGGQLTSKGKYFPCCYLFLHSLCPPHVPSKLICCRSAGQKFGYRTWVFC